MHNKLCSRKRNTCTQLHVCILYLYNCTCREKTLFFSKPQLSLEVSVPDKIILLYMYEILCMYKGMYYQRQLQQHQHQCQYYVHVIISELIILMWYLQSYKYTQARMLRKQPNGFDVTFLNFHIYFVSEQGNRFGAKAIPLGYLGYLNFYFLIFSVFSKLSV